jgi:hypothetical protein
MRKNIYNMLLAEQLSIRSDGEENIAPIGDDGIWLSGAMEDEPEETVEETECDRNLSVQFLHRRSLLVKHLHLFCQKGEIQGRLTPPPG